MVHAFTEVRNQLNAIEFIKPEAKAKQVSYSLVLVKRLYEVLYSNLHNACRSSSAATCRCTGRTPRHSAAGADQDRVGAALPVHGERRVPRMHPFKAGDALAPRFMEIFPFSDLSGKVGRMMMNLILIRAGYMPLVIPQHGPRDVLRRAPG